MTDCQWITTPRRQLAHLKHTKYTFNMTKHKLTEHICTTDNEEITMNCKICGKYNLIIIKPYYYTYYYTYSK